LDVPLIQFAWDKKEAVLKQVLSNAITHITTKAFEQIKIPLDKLGINQPEFCKCEKSFYL